MKNIGAKDYFKQRHRSNKYVGGRVTWWLMKTVSVKKRLVRDELQVGVSACSYWLAFQMEPVHRGEQIETKETNSNSVSLWRVSPVLELETRFLTILYVCPRGQRHDFK